MKIGQLITLFSFIILFSFSCESSIINENVKNLNQITETAKDINLMQVIWRMQLILIILTMILSLKFLNWINQKHYLFIVLLEVDLLLQ